MYLCLLPSIEKNSGAWGASFLVQAIRMPVQDLLDHACAEAFEDWGKYLLPPALKPRVCLFMENQELSESSGSGSGDGSATLMYSQF